MSETKAMSDDAAAESPRSRERGLMDAVRELERVTRGLEQRGVLALLLTVSLVIWTAGGSMIIQGGFRAFPTGFNSRAIFVLISITLAFLNLVILIRYERLHKRGDTLFDEISDELSWFTQPSRGQPSSRPAPVATPPIDVRVVLRSFTRNADLPLVAGRFGPGVYGLINLLVIFFVMLWGLA
ncbi:MAG TPA: hypothetical protein VE913_09240 [Longimicrobium sp.]|nr:hypothetical protein [Longimicrobium sp.]